MPLFGSHLSIAGGYYKAVDKAAELGMQTVQIFTKNNNQWKGKPLTDQDVEKFQTQLKVHGIQKPCAHDSYLINLGSPKDELWQKSIDALVVEVTRAEMLGLEGVVMHPGSYTETDEQTGLDRIAEGLNRVFDELPPTHAQLWLEVTAGQGTNLGYRFEHLAEIIDKVEASDRLGVCLDTCHMFAAGYPMIEKSEYEETMQQLDGIIGFDRVKAVHINDSKKGLGSRVDRHDHIGEGELGLEPFRHLLNDPRFAEMPLYLETKKEDRDGVPMDAINLQVLKSLME